MKGSVKTKAVSLFTAVCMVLMLFHAPLTALAAEADGFQYDINGDTVTITGYTGSGGDVEIPSVIDGNPVTSIGEHAFLNCDSLASITIPDSVTTIGDIAFRNCYALVSITIPDSVTTIGECAFDFCTSLESIKIPNGVTTIRGSTFSQCSALTSVEIPDSVTSIEDGAFSGCTSLATIKIPNGVTTIGNDAFNHCTSLVSIKIPNGVTTIGDNAFYSCTSLASITIPDSVTSIEAGAFYSCTSLASIQLPDSVTTIGDAAFNYCTSLESITIPNGVTTIGSAAFSGCGSLALIVLPDGCDTTQADIPDGATQIKYTIDGDGNVTITSITLGKGQTGVTLPTTIGGRPVTAVNCNHNAGRSYTDNGDGMTHTEVCDICKQAVGDPAPHSGNGTCNECGGKIAAAVTITWETQEPLTYTGQPAAITPPTVAPENAGTISYSYAKDGGGFTNGLPVDAGTYTVRAATAGSADYMAASADTTLTIEKATITVTAEDKTAAAGDAAPALTYTVTGLVNGEQLKTPPTVAYETTPDMSKAGTTAIKASGAEAPDGGNYTITYVDGTLTVTPAIVTNYTVTFNSQGGSAVSSQTVTAGGKVTKPSDPTRSGYDFGGWYKESTCATAWNFDTDTVTGNITLYAKWTATLPNTYTVTFNSQGGSAVSSQPVTAGGKVTKPSDPTRSGYDFGGWYKESTCATAWNFDTDTVTGNITLYAKWTATQPNTYTVTFNSQGGSAVSSQPVTAGGKVTKPGNPTRSGYNFGGWYKDSGYTVAWNFNTDTVTENITLYAKWTAKPTSGGGGGTYTPPTYPPTVEKPNEGGTVTVSPSRPSAGDKVTVRPKPDSGYEVENVTVTDRNGRPVTVTKNPDGSYSFTQPSGTVKVEVSYKPTETTPVETVWNNPFTDISEGAWYYDAVRYVNENGLMNGYSNGTFGPNDYLSRAQLAQILFNKEGRPGVNYLLQFGDVSNDTWYTEAVRWAASQGIVGGYGDGRFGPNDNITREQLAVMLWRYAGSPAATNRELHFNDIGEAGGFAMDALCWAVENSILNGYGDGRLGPKGLATRAQVAQMLKNYLEDQ